MELKGFLQVLSNRKWLLLAIVSVSVLATYLIATQAPPDYKAQIRLVAGITNGSNSMFTLGDERGLERYEVETRFRHLEEMIQSPRVLSLVSYQLMIHDLSESAPFRELTEVKNSFSNDELRIVLRNLRTKRDSMQMLNASDELELRHLKLIESLGYNHESLRQDLDVRRVPGTDYISIEYTGDKPDMAAFVVNQVGREFVRFYLLTNSELAESSLITMTELVGERRDILDNQIKEWGRFNQQQSLQSSIGGMQLLEEIDVLEAAKEESEKQILTAERIIIEAEQGLPRMRGEEALSTTASFGEGSLLRNKLQRLNQRYVRSGMKQVELLDSLQMVRRRLVDLLVLQEQTQMGEINDDVIRLMRQVKEGEIDLFIAQTRITAIAQELRALSSQAGSFVDPGLSATMYGKEVQLARDAYLTSLNRLNSAKLGFSGRELGTVGQLEFAQAPDKPEPSMAFLLAVLAGIISLGVAISILLLLEYLDESIKLPSRFTSMTGIELLGTLVKIKSSNLDLISLFHSDQNNPQLETYKQQLRILRHEITLEDPVTLMVTSTRSGSGKSSILVSLAYSLSLTGKKVLMMDTNLVNGSLTAMTGASPTLQSYLSGSLPKDALISPSVFDNVDVIGCAVSKSSPLEAFKHDSFEQLLVHLSDDYDHILMEGASLNEFVDARELLLYSAKILPVFAADAPIEESDLHNIAYLKQHSDKLMGAVLNKVESRHINL